MINSADYTRCSKAPPADQAKFCTSQDSDCDCIYGSQEAAKLDAVLASVYKLIEGLENEIDNDRKPISDSNPVAIATDHQLSSFHHVTHHLVNWSQSDADVITGASKHHCLDVEPTTDKKLNRGGETTHNKQNDEKSSFMSKENKDLSLLSTSDTAQGPEVDLKRRFYARKHDASSVVNKQMTQSQPKLDYFPNNNIISLPVIGETKLGPQENYHSGREPAVLSSEANSLKKETIEKKENSLSNDIESIIQSVDDKKSISDALDHLDIQIGENWTSFSSISSAQQLKQIRKDKQVIDENVRARQSRDCEKAKYSKFKEFFSQKLSRKSKDSNDSVVISDDSSCDSEEDVFESASLKSNSNFIEKVVNMSAMAKRKAFLQKQKRLFRSLRRSQGKRMNSEKQKSFEDRFQDWDAINFGIGVKIEDYGNGPEVVKTNTRGNGFMRYTLSEPSGMGQFMKETEYDTIEEEPCPQIFYDYHDDEDVMTMHRVSSESKLPPLQENELDDDEEEEEDMFSYRDVRTISLFSTSSEHLPADSSRRWKSKSESTSNLLSPHHPNMPQRASTGHLERLADSPKEKRFDLNSKGSQDSLDILLEPISRLASKLYRTKLRNPLKNVGKSSSVPHHEADENALRTWYFDGNSAWNNKLGKKVELGSTNLQSLSELECEALQKLSLQKLHEAEIGVHIVVPKDDSSHMKRKISARKRRGMLLMKEKNKEKTNDHVFGIPLLDVVENDQLLRLQKSFSPSMDCPHLESPSFEDHVPHLHTPTRSDAYSSLSSGDSSCSGSSSSLNNERHISELERHIHNTTSAEIAVSNSHLSTSPKHPDSDSDSDKESSSPTQASTPTSRPKQSSTSQSLRRRDAIAAHSINEIDPDQCKLLEALSLSVQSGTNQNQKKVKDRSMLPPTMPQVPYVVQKCCDYIKKYGLDAEGIFRIAGSRKRIKQLREDFDRGVDVTIDEDYSPHDVAALLKEFFRDLPEALLTRELFPAFIQTTKMEKQLGLKCLRYLLWLLPLSNRDTLYTLLNFLAVVAAHAETGCDHHGHRVPGNKMNVYNLAAIFGPNILHRYKNSQAASDSHFLGPSLESAEDTTAGIKVVEELITNQVQLFQIPKEEHDEILRTLKEWNPIAVDYLLRRKAANQMKDHSRLPSLASIGSHAKVSPQLTPAYDHCSEIKRKSGNWGASPITPEPVASKIEDEFEKALDSDVFVRSSTLRMSYQQATGHIPLQEDENDIKEHHEKHRHVHKTSQRHFAGHHDQQKIDRTTTETDEHNSANQTLHNHIKVTNRVSNNSAASHSPNYSTAAYFSDGDVKAILNRTKENEAKRLESRPQVLELKFSRNEQVKNSEGLRKEEVFTKNSRNELSNEQNHKEGSFGSSQACYLGPYTYCDRKGNDEKKKESRENGDCNNNQCLYKEMCTVEDHTTTQNTATYANSNNNNNRFYAQQPLHLHNATVTTINNVLNPCSQANTPPRPVPRPRTRLPSGVRSTAYNQTQDGASSYPNEYFSSDFSRFEHQYSHSVEFRSINTGDEMSQRQNAPQPKTARRTKFLSSSDNVRNFDQMSSPPNYSWDRERLQTEDGPPRWSSTPYHSNTQVTNNNQTPHGSRYAPPQVTSHTASWYGLTNNNKHLSETLV